MSRLNCFLRNADLTIDEAIWLYRCCGPQDFYEFTVRFNAGSLLDIPCVSREDWFAIVHVVEYARNVHKSWEFCEIKLVRYLIAFSHFDLAHRLNAYYKLGDIPIYTYIENGSIKAMLQLKSQSATRDCRIFGNWWEEAPLSSTELLDLYDIWDLWTHLEDPIRNSLIFLESACQKRSLVAVEWFIEKGLGQVKSLATELEITWVDICAYLREYFEDYLLCIAGQASLWAPSHVMDFFELIRTKTSCLLTAPQRIFIENKYIHRALREPLKDPSEKDRSYNTVCHKSHRGHFD